MIRAQDPVTQPRVEIMLARIFSCTRWVGRFEMIQV